MTSTGKIGPLRIIKTERIQDGVERFEFAAGVAAVIYDQQRDAILSESALVLRVPAEQLPLTADRFFQEWKQRGKENAELKKKLTEVRLQATKKTSAEVEVKDGEVKASKPSAKEIKFGTEHIKILTWIIDADIKELLHTSQGLLNENAVAILGGVSSGRAHIVITVRSDIAKKGLDAALIVKEASNVLGGSGGGRLERAQGGGPHADKIDEAVHKALRLVRDKLEEIGQTG